MLHFFSSDEIMATIGNVLQQDEDLRGKDRGCVRRKKKKTKEEEQQGIGTRNGIKSRKRKAWCLGNPDVNSL
jgi:hypothetical protein